MSKEGIFSVNGKDVDYADNLEEVIAAFAGTDPESEDGSPTPNRGRHVAGTNLGTIFAPFSSYFKSSGDVEYFAPFTDLKSEDELSIMSEEEQKIYNHYLSKFSTLGSFIVSDENLEDDYKNRRNGECFKIQAGFHDTENFRTIGLRAPVFISGFGINSSGRQFNNEEVGPLDIVYNKKRGYWEHRQKYPVAGRIKSNDGNNLYTVEIVGLVRDGEESWDMTLASTGVSNICGEEDKYELEEVYGVEETNLSAGQYVSVFYDARSDSKICIAGGGQSLNPKLYIDDEIGDDGGTSIDIPDGKILSNISYKDIEGETVLNFETDCLRVTS